nr:MAG TPA: hypothetical protein [Caudoviricetes sp.]
MLKLFLSFSDNYNVKQINHKSIMFYSNTHKVKLELMLYLSTFLHCICIT